VIKGSSSLPFGKHTEWRPELGIAKGHWEAFSNYAFAKDYYVFIRGGKEEAIRFIERGFPGKPMELGFLKVDKDLGLLKAKDPGDRAQVFAFGHSIVMEKEVAGTKQLAAFLYDEGRPLAPGERDWVTSNDEAEGVVIDKATRKPFTSDYDLWSVVDAREFDYGSTIGSDALLGRTPGGKVSFTSSLVEEVRRDLNALLGSARFLHGTQAQFVISQEAAAEPERIVGFCPDGQAVYFEGTSGQLEVVFRDIYADLNRSGPEIFRQ